MDKLRDKNKEKVEFLKAVDIVCGSCDYCEETYCTYCPVRKTVDRMNAEKPIKIYYEVTNTEGEIYGQYNTEQEAIECADTCFLNDLDIELCINVYCVEEEKQGEVWHMTRSEIIYTLNREEAYNGN